MTRYLLPLVLLTGCSLFQDPCERAVEAFDDCGYNMNANCKGVTDDELKCMADAMEDGCDVYAACICAYTTQECSGGDDSGWDTW